MNYFITNSIDNVEQTIFEEFDEHTWEATEAVLAAHATLLLKDNDGTGLILVGPSGSGKTTVLRFFENELDDMFYRSDDVTPASFVSHDASKSDDQLEEIDLLPRIKEKTLIARDMATWFSGEEESISKRMSVMTNILDGEGYTRDTGTHGQRGYTGTEFRFNFIGASTPLSPRAWQIMGNVGNRLVFHEMPGTPDLGSVITDVTEGSSYNDKVACCQDVIHGYLRQLWEETGGFETVECTPENSMAINKTLEYLVRIVQYGRAPLYNDQPQPEGGHRITAALWALAQGRAVLYGRRSVVVEDMEVCGRIALSTMPQKRRPLIRGLLNPDNERQLTARDVETLTGVSRPTAHTRMKEIDSLGIGRLHDMEDDGRETKVLELAPEFDWPAPLDFPSN